MKLYDKQVRVIVQALRIAAEQFDRDGTLAAKAGEDRLCVQFNGQAREALALADRLDDAHEVEVHNSL